LHHQKRTDESMTKPKRIYGLTVAIIAAFFGVVSYLNTRTIHRILDEEAKILKDSDETSAFLAIVSESTIAIGHVPALGLMIPSKFGC